ncbi:MAG: hypothetical protein ACRDD2_10950 [Sarcina sp.]
MIIDKEDNLNLDLNSISYKCSDIKALARKLVYSKNVSAEPIGFLCFLASLLIFIPLSIVGIIFSNGILLTIISAIVMLLCISLIIGYAFMKSIQTTRKNKVTIKYIFNLNVFFIFFLALVIFTLIVYFLYTPISYGLIDLMGGSPFLHGLFNSINSTAAFVDFLMNFTLVLILKELAKALIIYFIGIVLFLIIFNIFAYPAYIAATKEVTILYALKEGFKLSFKNMVKLLKIEFSFIHIIFFTIWIQIIFIWKGLYFFTSISLVMEKSIENL